MPFQPGCHRPFSRSVVRRSVADIYRELALCILFDFCFLCSRSSPSIVVGQHVITSSVITLRPFALSFTSWRVLGSLWKVADSNRLLIPSSSGNTAAAVGCRSISSVGVRGSYPFPLFHLCRFAPIIPAFTFPFSRRLRFCRSSVHITTALHTSCSISPDVNIL